ncbi:MAG TPA: alpha-L-rhamnosidase C-terminal domain-containing protein [Bacteroidales bacterium]|nr:alpha-L-rhamnosidase C-terminal domain-containing protein [Bacteroidales bacterium]
MNRMDQALHRMKLRYTPMVNSRLSTLWETWEYDDSPGSYHGNTGYNHGWGGGPLILLSEYVAGMKPDMNQANSFIIRPRLAGMDHVMAGMMTVTGMLEMLAEVTADTLHLTVSLPKNCTATLCIPRLQATGSFIYCNNRKWIRNGKVIEVQEGIEYLHSDEAYDYLKVRSGNYTFMSARE